MFAFSFSVSLIHVVGRMFRVFFFSSYLGPSGGNYGVINSRIKRRPSSHLEMEISECESLRRRQNAIPPV